MILVEAFCGCTCCFMHENISLLSNLNIAINLQTPDVMSYDLTCLDHDDGGATTRGGGGQI